MARRVLTGLADFGIVFDPFDLTAFDHLRLARNELWGVVVRRSLPLAAPPTVTAEALLARPLILSRQMLGKNGLAGWLGGAASARPTRSTTPRSSWSRKAWATSSPSRASSPRPNRESTSSGRSSRPLEAGMHLIWKKGAVFTPLQRAVMEEIRRSGRSSEEGS